MTTPVIPAPTSPLPPGGAGGGQDHLDLNLPSVWFDDETRNQRAAAYLAQRDANNTGDDEAPVLFELSGLPLTIVVILFALAMILIATYAKLP
ncbi:MAG TPA: hypothetical protein PKY60_15020 [Thermoflexales bacterium]|nr:hypothetical protein [Thermoflexales bacterium]